MTSGRSTPESGSRVTRLGLVGLGFMVGVIVTLLVIYMLQSR